MYESRFMSTNSQNILVFVKYFNNKIQKKSTNLTLIITGFLVKSLHAAQRKRRKSSISQKLFCFGN